MPLDANKAAHIQAAILRTFQGRQKTVVFVYQSAGSYSYTTVLVIFRPQEVIDPQIMDSPGEPPHPHVDTLMIVPIAISLAGLVYVADTTTPSALAVAGARKYQVIEALTSGILPSGTRSIVKLRRFR